MKSKIDLEPWDDFVGTNDFYMGYRGWERYEPPERDKVKYVFPGSLSGALAEVKATTLGTALLQVLECHFTWTPRGLRIRVITSGAPGGCHKHDSTTFRVEIHRIRSLHRLLDAVEERATATASTELADCLIFGDCAKRVLALLDLAAARSGW